MTVLAMSHGELSRFDTLMRVECGELRVEDAATVLSLKRRQIFRLLERLRSDGAAGLVSRKCGPPEQSAAQRYVSSASYHLAYPPKATRREIERGPSGTYRRKRT